MKLPRNNKEIAGSFRDPSGFLFCSDSTIYRQINNAYKENFDHLIACGLYKKLTESGLLIRHDEVPLEYAVSEKAYKVIKPERIPFISYPYEWCFSQLKDAALTTLEIQSKALDFGMSLKDCSAYNIQFYNGKPIFIDTLSFEQYKEGQPWVAYRQFCQHFLAPLALMCHKDVRLNQLLKIYIDGVPLDMASSLLPFHTRFSLSLFSHIHLHAKSQKHYADKAISIKGRKMSRLSFLGILDDLKNTIEKMNWQPKGTEWADYYNNTNYSTDAIDHKKEIVSEFLDKTDSGTVWDIGANTGTFSRIAANKGMRTVSFDIDPAAVEKNYLECIGKNVSNILPLVLDLTNPSPGIGWENRERISLQDRGPADTVLALALIHHLAISNNLPFIKIAKFFSTICRNLIIEFVPKQDSQVQKLLTTREDIFTEYDKDHFETEFMRYFTIKAYAQIKGTKRILYLLHKTEEVCH